jgi:hypothetical protein
MLIGTPLLAFGALALAQRIVALEHRLTPAEV